MNISTHDWEILCFARDPHGERDWGGNAYDIIIDEDAVNIEDQLDDTTLAVLPHQDFIAIIEGYLAELDTGHAEHGTAEKRIDLHHPELNPEGKSYHQK